MTVTKIVLIALGSALALGLVGGKIISTLLKNRAKPGYKPLLSGRESLLCGLSALVGVALIVVGVFVMPQINQPTTEDELKGPESSEGAAGEENISSNSGGGSVSVTHRTMEVAPAG